MICVSPIIEVSIQTFIDKNTGKIPHTVIIATEDQPVPPVPEDEYSVVKGKDSTWKEGSSSGLSFKIERKEEDASIRFHFRRIEVDGVEIPQNYYHLRKGSLIVELKTNLLNKLAAGKHTLTVVFNDGEAEAIFYLSKNKPHYAPPVTGIE